MWLLVGLGNIGAQYERTRHNAGFMALDAMIQHYGVQDMGKKFHAQTYKGMIDGVAVIALKPHTLMNRSGISVGEAAAFFKIPPAQVIIIHDDLDLTLAKMRVKCGGGHGGHNGLKDVDRVLGRDYWRVRVGIDRPNHAGQVTSYVLSPFTAEEQQKINDVSDALARTLPWLLHGQAKRMMTDVARIMQDAAP